MKLAVRKKNGSWVWGGQKLRVQQAKFGARKNVKQNFKPHPNIQAKGRKWIYRIKSPRVQTENFQPLQNSDQTRNENGKGFPVQPIGNGWLLRSAIAKVRRLLSPEELVSVFKMENTPIDHVKAIGGRYVIITFPNASIRDECIKEGWLINWFDEISPWSGEAAKEERFVWLSCFGMPLNGWTIPNDILYI